MVLKKNMFKTKKYFFIFQAKGKTNESESKKVKLDDSEKSQQISFYKEN